MAKSFPSVLGFEHLKGPTLLAATANGLLALVVVLDTPSLIESRASFQAFTFSMAGLGEGLALAMYLALLVFFVVFYLRLVGAAGATNIGRYALFAAIAIILSTILDTYFRSILHWNLVEFLKWLFGVGVVPALTLSLFLGMLALRSSSLTSAAIRRISAVLAATMGLQAILRTKSLVAELIRIGFRADWAWAGWWSFLLQLISAVASMALAIFFLGIWRRDKRAIRRVCSVPISVQRWAWIRFGALGKLSKVLVVAQAVGAVSVLAGSVTYVSPYNVIWSLLGRVLLLPGSGMAFWMGPDRFGRSYEFLDNFVYTAVSLMLNTGLFLLVLGFWKSIRFRRQEL
jgi:hypothetical protein